MPKQPSDRSPASADVDRAVAALRERTDLVLEAGLSAAELAGAEQQFGLRFPPLWRAVLAVCHPVALPEPPRDPDGVLRHTAVPDWRGRDPQATGGLVGSPTLGVLFDVEVNDFWWPEWGRRPRRRADRIAAAGEHLAVVPKLVPLWGHLYVSADDGSPVLSIVQTDLYCPADSLLALLDGSQADGRTAAGVTRIEFWSDLLDWSQGG